MCGAFFSPWKLLTSSHSHQTGMVHTVQHILIKRHRYEHRKRLTRKYVTCTCSLRPEVKHLLAYQCYFPCYSQSQTLQFLESYNIPTLSGRKVCPLTWTRVPLPTTFYAETREITGYWMRNVSSYRFHITGVGAYFLSGHAVRDGLVSKIIKSMITRVLSPDKAEIGPDLIRGTHSLSNGYSGLNGRCMKLTTHKLLWTKLIKHCDPRRIIKIWELKPLKRMQYTTACRPPAK
jgi:hypothetical protein